MSPNLQNIVTKPSSTPTPELLPWSLYVFVVLIENFGNVEEYEESTLIQNCAPQRATVDPGSTEGLRVVSSGRPLGSAQ